MNSLQTKKLSSFARTGALRVVEFFMVAILALVFLSRMLFHLLIVIPDMPHWLDRWYMCYVLEHQVTRILGLNPGGLWDGGFYFPFQGDSLLFDEPSWGVSLLVAPFWGITQNIFKIFRLGGIPALVLAWICTYYFVKRMGGSKFWAFCAGFTFCLSGISLVLITQQYIFWPFFLIPLLGMVTLKIFDTPQWYWGVLWGALFGFLAWSSAHLFVMGGSFLGFLVFWHLRFRSHSKETWIVLLTGLLLAAVIASGVLIPMFLVSEEYGFFRNYSAPYLHASNWANLFYKGWPPAPAFNSIAKTAWWDWLAIHAKGETPIGISLALFCGAAGVFFTRLWTSRTGESKDRGSIFRPVMIALAAAGLAFINMHSLTVRCVQLRLPPPELATGTTYLGYVAAGMIFYLLSKRILSAAKHLDFFMLLAVFFFGLLTFGPYYLMGNRQVLASPVAFLIYHVPGISGIQATARWGLLLSFSLSIAVAVFLSRPTTGRKTKIFALALMGIAFFELSPGLGFRLPASRLLRLSPYQWTPRETDVFLKSLPGHGAVLELSSYPIRREQYVDSINSLGYALFSRLYHKKPLVTGYASHVPHVTHRYLFGPEDKTLSESVIHGLRKFGAKYFVFHIEDWSPEEVRSLKVSIGELKQIAELDRGKTLIYEDPEPQVKVDCYDMKP